MDIYKFFNVFHNPRLHSTPPRQQELSELELAISEVRKALERLQLRSKRKAIGPILPEHFSDILKAARFIEHSLGTLAEAHPGDSKLTIEELVNERQSMRGWESWSSLLSEQIKAYENDEEHLNQTASEKPKKAV